MPVEKNHSYVVEITDIASDGRGIGHIDGMTVFVAGAVTGDRAEVMVQRVKKRFAEGVLNKVIHPSKHRIEPDCPYFGTCGGCQTANIDYPFELAVKAENVTQAMRRIGGIKDFRLDKISSGSEKHYRNKAVYKIENSVCGFYSEKTHHMIPIQSCMLCSEKDRDILAALSEKSENCFGELFIRRAKNTRQTMVVLNTEQHLSNMEELAEEIRKADDSVVSVIFNFSNESVIFGEKVIEDTLMGIKFRISDKSFYQVNPEMTERLYRKALEYADLTGAERVLDIYCGIGTISLCAAQQAEFVTGIEIVPQAIENAKENAKLNGLENTAFYADSAERIVPKLISVGERPDVVILDPPRKGSDEETLVAIVHAAPKRIVYVSCNPATLARDTAFLLQGDYKITAAEAFDMFPRTAHVETCVLLSKLKSSKSVTIDLDLDALETTAAEVKATYGEIKEYILNKYGFKVSSLNIAQVKKECGIIERENFNKPSGKYRQPNCPKHKFNAIKEALGHFKMI